MTTTTQTQKTTTDFEGKQPELVQSWASEGNPSFAPSSIVAHNDLCYVADEVGNAVYLFDQNFQIQKKIGKKGKGPGEFWYPTSLVRDNQGQIYVADRWNHRIQIFDAELNYIDSIGTYGNALGEFNDPVGLLYSNGLLYIAEHSNGRIQAFDEKGKAVHSFENNAPIAAFYKSDNFRKNEHYLNWFDGCSRFNTVETQFYNDGFRVGILEYPQKLSAYDEDKVLVIDKANQQCVIFSADLQPIHPFRPKGNDSGFFPTHNAFYDATSEALWISSENASADQTASNLCCVKDGRAIFFTLGDIRISSFSIHQTQLFAADFWNGGLFKYEISG